MPLANRAAHMIVDKLPKVVDAKTHAILDYAVGGACLALGAFFWKRNKRAAIAATMCGAATLTNAMLTDYPGGVKKILSFETHGEIDAGLAGLTATMPSFFSFRGEPEARYFTGLALAETVIAGITDFRPRGEVIEMPIERPA